LVGNKGIKVDLKKGQLRKDALLFAETQSRAIVSLAQSNLPALEKIAKNYNLSYYIIGNVVDNSNFNVSIDGEKVLDVAVKDLQDKYYNTIPNLLKEV